jgi:hypothetical protein
VKLYFFIHSKCNGMYAAIQAGHCAIELMLKYKNEKSPQANQVSNWAKLFKTFILLDGGVPWAEFREPDCGNMVTAIAVVVPDGFLDSISEKKIQHPLWRLFTESRLAK